MTQTITPRPGSTLRWLVRREAVRAPRLGENRRDVTQWTLRQYFQLPNGTRVVAYPTYYPTLALAAEAARRRCAEHYGCTAHQHTRRAPMRPAHPYGGRL